MPQVQLAPVQQRSAGGSIPFVQLTKSQQCGARWCNKGDVIKVLKMGEAPLDDAGQPGTLMPPVSAMDYQRAQKLIEMGVAVPHAGPATVDVAEVENASLKQVIARGEQAVAPPQRDPGKKSGAL